VQAGPDIQATFALIALTAVVPKDLDKIPMTKIIEIRQRYGTEFDNWHDHIDSIGAWLAQNLRDIESPSMLDAYLQEAVQRYQTEPLRRLRRGLTDLGVETAHLAVNSKYELPAALATAGLATQPYLAAAAGIAVAVTGLRRMTRDKARAKLQSPVTYLLNVEEELSPTSLLDRVLALMRRASGLRG
jgi:hypothetical protein